MKVFISYSRIEASVTAQAIHNYLTEIGHHEVFIDTSDIHGGDEWWKIIEDNISDCDIFVIIITRSALNRQYVKEEVELAINLKKKIIPCIAKYVNYEDLQLNLDKIHGIRYENLDQLIQELGFLIDLNGKTQKKTDNSSSFSSEQLDGETKSIQLLLERAKGLEEIEQYSRALKTYDEVLKINPNNFEAYYNKGLLHEKSGDFENARKALDKATFVDWKHKDVWYRLGNVLEKLERYEEALDALNTDLRVDDKDVKSWISKAKLLEKMEKYDEALVAIDEIIKMDSANIDAFEQKGKILEQLSKYQEAIDCYDKILSIDINNKEALKNKNIAEENLKKQKYSEIISKIEPLFYDKKDYSAVINLCDKAIDIDKDNYKAYLYKANSLLKLSRYQEAIDCYNTVLAVDVNNKDAIQNKQTALRVLRIDEVKNSYENKDYSRVIEVTEFCNEIEGFDNDPILLKYKGDALSMLGNYNQALQYYDKILEIDPKNVYAFNKRRIVREQLYKQLDSKIIKHIFEKSWSIEIQPRDISVDPNGYVYVTTHENKSITHRKFLRDKVEWVYYDYLYKFDSNGTFIAKRGSYGTGDGQFSDPRSISVDTKGYVYVADSGNHRIQKFDSNGTFIATWGSQGDGDGQFSYPRGIAVDSSGYVYVADSANHRIQKFDSNGTFIATWGSYGTGDGQFSDPRGISVDTKGYVYVADLYNHRIQKFDSNGTFIATWGSQGDGDGQFSYPRGISVDSSGYVYVADSANHRIQKFDSNGTFIAKWGNEGFGDGQFSYPEGITVDTKGYVYVSDSDANCIKVFAPALE